MRCYITVALCQMGSQGSPGPWDLISSRWRDQRRKELNSVHMRQNSCGTLSHHILGSAPTVSELPLSLKICTDLTSTRHRTLMALKFPFSTGIQISTPTRHMFGVGLFLLLSVVPQLEEGL
ncbi:hypothetical protein H920_02034 [Fukomys damarensis]|uniref:Uncharacterized protein n=1 Tax=Fukomys damarensis TaxID=885580 RepID=A0A091E1Z6_FUKDA|nr:hypothetical protein H920_02034 [Fukomys damarensis]